MATTQTRGTVPAFVAQAAALISNVSTSLSAAQKRRTVYRRTFNELASLNDRELSDLGIARANISKIAKEAADVL